MWKCPECQTANPDDAHFCTCCGRQSASGAGAPGADSKGLRIGLWLLLGALVLGCVVLAAVLLLRSRPPKPAPSPEPTVSATPEPSPATTPTPILIQTPTPTPFQSGYLEDASQLKSRGLEQLQRKMEDTITENVRTTWSAPEHLLRSEYVGFYLLAGESDSAQPRNILVLVYHNDVNISISREKVNKDISYFYCLRFENVWCGEDGSLSLSEPARPAEQVNANIPRHNFYYKGYVNLEELYRRQVEPNLRGYTLSQSFPGSLDYPLADVSPVQSETPDLAEIAERVLAHYRPILSTDAGEQKLYVIFDSEIREYDGKYLMTIRYQGSPTTANVYVMDVSVEKDTGRVSSSLKNDSPWNLW